MWFWIAVAVRIVSNPCSNALQKRLAHDGAGPLTTVAVTHALLSPACLPIVATAPLPVGGVFWTNLLIAVVLAVVCNALIVAAMRRDDLSVLGPINAFKSIVSLLPAWLLLRETPGILGLAGIGLIAVGSLGLADRRRDADPATHRPLWSRSGVRLRIAALVVSAIEAVYLKRALAASTPAVTFAWWSILGAGVASAAVLAIGRRAIAPGPTVGEPRTKQRMFFVLLAVTTGLMQFTTLYALARAPVASSLALFQLSAVMSVLLGHHFFAEPNLARRLIGASVMTLGGVLIALDRGA